MTTVPFSGLTPTRALYVSVGSGSGNGSKANPYHSIQQAVNSATPGTIIYVEPGTYHENIKIAKDSGGTASAPVWLVSQGGPGAAQIVAASSTKPVIQGLGVDNYVIKDLTLSGGYDGIQFSQSGRDFTNLVNNIVLQGNTIKNALHDGLKIGQANNVYIGDNSIDGVKAEEGIDMVAVNDAIVERNEISNDHGTVAAIFAKGGSTHIQILDNYIHDVAGDGISAGGWTSASSFRPGYTSYEAKDVIVSGNQIENVAKRPVSVRGASDVTVTDNYLAANAKYPNAVYVSTGNPNASHVALSSDVHITNNVLNGVKTIVKIDAGNGVGVVQSGNANGVWHQVAGPADLGTSHSAATAAPITPLVSDDPASSAATAAPHTTSVTATIGSNLGDTLKGNNSANTLIGGNGNDHISGQGGADILIGGAGDDALSGNGGNDKLEGGVGNDTLTGGSGGRDWFAFTAHSWGHDTITDFDAKADVLDFRGSGMTSADLHITQQAENVLISNADHSSTILLDHAQIAQISPSDFLF